MRDKKNKDNKIIGAECGDTKGVGTDSVLYINRLGNFNRGVI